ncbi:MAG TPA: hypothetical protein VN364_10675 [Bellilinea sp.]|nr:hypothetical protein [Bellilinea sp.]
MTGLKRLFARGLLILAIGGLIATAALQSAPVRAQEETPEGPEAPKRLTTLTVDYTAYEWWLVRWRGNEITCRFIIDHEGLPISDEILTWCGDIFHSEWQNTKPCQLSTPGQSVENCPGNYLHFFESKPAKKQVEVELPLPSVWVSLTGCTVEPPGNRCIGTPQLQLIGEEPLPNEAIISIQGIYQGEPFTCSGNPCNLPLKPTGSQGADLEFWADSSFGDSSQHYTGLVRVLPRGDFMSPEGASSDSRVYYVDVITDQWRGGPQASCSDTWQAFPESGGIEPWLTTPLTAADLYTEVSLYYLAAMLITNNQVDASSCPSGGLESPLSANECGLAAARDEVIAWQNQFDEQILSVGRETGIPAQLLKNVFSRESQFWPGMYINYKEAGLGQLTDQGAETVLLWNRDFYDQFCPLVLHQSRCDLGFGNLILSEQAMLQGALVTKVNASCVDCPAGIDLAQAEFSVRVFAETMAANCEQTSRIITNTTGLLPGKAASYADLWRFTLVNYNAGAGCLTTAIKRTYLANEPLTWDNVSSRLEVACSGALDYVNDISLVNSGVLPTPTTWVVFGTPQVPTGAIGTLLATSQTTATPTPRPGQATATPAQSGYPYPGPLPTVTVGNYPAPTPSYP